jgi:hypothetical protein
MNIRDQGHIDLSDDPAECLGIRPCRHRNPDQIAARRDQTPNLPDAGLHIRGIDLGHGLNRDDAAPANPNLADRYDSAFSILHDDFLLRSERRTVPALPGMGHTE